MTPPRHDSCPLEEEVARALDAAGIEWFPEDAAQNEARLDFWLPEYELYIEVKGGPTERTRKQLARAQNVIVVQGRAAVKFLVAQMKMYEHQWG